jgi:ADP-ribose pyrophosphatase
MCAQLNAPGRLSNMGDEALRETPFQTKVVYEGRIISVEHWQVRLPDGREAFREVVKHPGAAAIVPVDKDGYVTLVRQHRVSIDRMTWEIPAGKLNFAGEDPYDCAVRELEEETGLRAGKWDLLTRADTTPGFCTERIALYLATDLTQHETHMDEDEFLVIKRIPLREAVDQVMAGKLSDAKTALGILMAFHRLNG